MKRAFNIANDLELKDKTKKFMSKLNSEIDFNSELDSVLNSLEWLEEIEKACPYIDNIVRRPRVALVSETEVHKIERAKKITVESIKDLAKHTNYIEKVDEKTKDVKPSKILVLLREETFNTYENRFIYTLIHEMIRFVLRKERLLNDLELRTEKKLDYSGDSNNGNENIKIELSIVANEAKSNTENKQIQKQLEEIRKRLRKVKIYFTSWQNSEMMKSLDKLHVPYVVPPIKKTNLILKNPNFKVATKLWDYLRKHMLENDNKKKSVKGKVNSNVEDIINNSFNQIYNVLDLVSSQKKDLRRKLISYSVLMMNSQFNLTKNILAANGINLSDQEIFKLITLASDDKKNAPNISSEDVKKKMKKEMEEYLSKVRSSI